MFNALDFGSEFGVGSAHSPSVVQRLDCCRNEEVLGTILQSVNELFVLFPVCCKHAVGPDTGRLPLFYKLYFYTVFDSKGFVI